MAITKTHRSGWCLKYPVTEFNQTEHDGCYKNFMSSVCECDCGHKGERSLESRETRFQPFVPPKLKEIKVED